MPRLSTLSSYGPEYEQLLLRADAALTKSPEFVVQFDSPETATSIRMRSYGYFKALRADTSRPDLVAMVMGLSMRIAGSALVFFRRENSTDAVALRHALGLADGFADAGASTGVIAPSSGQTDALDRLRAIRERKS